MTQFKHCGKRNHNCYNEPMPYQVYILRCKDGTLYTGITNNLPARFLAHKKGVGAKYTKAHPPEKIVYQENKRTKGLALKLEYRIKQLSREQKLLLIGNGDSARFVFLNSKNKPKSSGQGRGNGRKPKKEGAVNKTK